MKNARGAQAPLLLPLPFSERLAASQLSPSGRQLVGLCLALALQLWAEKIARVTPLVMVLWVLQGATQHMLPEAG